MRDRDGQSYRRVASALEPPMFFLGVVFVPVMLGPMLSDLSSGSARAMEIAAWVIWVAFVVEYVWLLYLAPDRREMMRTHKLDLVIVLVPVLRPLRFLRVFRVASASTGLGRGMVALRQIGGRPGFRPFFLILGTVIVVGASFALAFEHGQDGASIDHYGDALWWAIVTCTTVGYGDHFPVTAGGQIVAVVLMLLGIGALSVLTASIAALFIEQDEEPELADLKAQLDRIEQLLLEPVTTHARTSSHEPLMDATDRAQAGIGSVEDLRRELHESDELLQTRKANSQTGFGGHEGF